MLRRFAVATALSAILVATVTGCGRASDPPAGPASPKADPAAVLAAAVAKTTGISLKFVIVADTADQNLNGGYDSVHKIAALVQGTGADAVSITATGDDLYLTNFAPGQTLHAQSAKLPAKSALTVFADPLGGLIMATGVASVSSSDRLTFTGKLDLTKVHGDTTGAQKFLEHVVTAAGAKATAIAFTAKVDGQGYLTEFDTTLPNFDDGKDSEFPTRFSDFGSPITNQVPTGSKVIEAPASFYAAA